MALSGNDQRTVLQIQADITDVEAKLTELREDYRAATADMGDAVTKAGKDIAPVFGAMASGADRAKEAIEETEVQLKSLSDELAAAAAREEAIEAAKEAKREKRRERDRARREREKAEAQAAADAALAAAAAEAEAALSLEQRLERAQTQSKATKEQIEATRNAANELVYAYRDLQQELKKTKEGSTAFKNITAEMERTEAAINQMADSLARLRAQYREQEDQALVLKLQAEQLARNAQQQDQVTVAVKESTQVTQDYVVKTTAGLKEVIAEGERLIPLFRDLGKDGELGLSVAEAGVRRLRVELEKLPTATVEAAAGINQALEATKGSFVSLSEAVATQSAKLGENLGTEVVDALKEWQKAFADFKRAVSAGTDQTSAEFAQIKQRAIETGEAFEQIGIKARTSMEEAAAATGVVPPALGKLNTELTIVNDQLRLVQNNATRAGESLGDRLAGFAERGALRTVAHLAVIGVALRELHNAGELLQEMFGEDIVEKLSDATSPVKLLTGLFRGLAQGIEDVEAGNERGVPLWQQVIDQMAALNDNLPFTYLNFENIRSKTSELTKTTLPLAESIAKVAAVREKEFEASAKSIAQLSRGTLTEEQAAEAVRKHEDALAQANATYEEKKKKVTSVAEASLLLYDRTQAVAKADREFKEATDPLIISLRQQAEASKVLFDHLNSQLDLEKQMRESLVGNKEALENRTAALERSIVSMFKHGQVNHQTTERIVEGVRGVLDEYEKLGTEPPKAISALAQRLGILTSAQQQVRDSIVGNGAALRDQTVAIEGAIRAAESYGEINNNSALQVQASLQTLLDEYAKFGKEVPEDLQRVADAYGAVTSAQKALQDSVLGNSAALAQQTKDIEKVIASVEKEGAATGPVRENIKKQLSELAAEYDKYGERVPQSLQRILDKYDQISQRQAEVQAAIEAATPDVLKPKTIDKDDLAKEHQGLQVTINDLERKQEVIGLNAEEVERLAEAQLAADRAQHQLNQGVSEAGGIWGDWEAKAVAVNEALGGTRGDVADLVDGVKSFEDTTKSSADAAIKSFEEAGEAIRKQLTENLEKGLTAVTDIKNVIETLVKKDFPELNDLTREFVALLAQGGA